MPYYQEINYLRGFAIISVIILHISAYFYNIPTITPLALFYMTIDSITHFAVPTFIFISGFVLYNKYNANIKLRDFYKKRLKTVVPPYLIFSTLYLVLKFIGAKLIGVKLTWTAPIILEKYLTGGAYFHLWFFVIIIELYLLCPLILEAYNYCNKKALLIISFFIGVFSPDNTVFEFLFFFVLGMYINENYEGFYRPEYFSTSIVLLVGTLTQIYGFAGKYYSYTAPRYWVLSSNIVSMIYFSMIFLELLYISKRLAVSGKLKIIDKIGTYSFQIYLIHAAFLEMFKITFLKIGFDWYNILFLPVMFVLILGFSFISIKIIQTLPKSECIIGFTK